MNFLRIASIFTVSLSEEIFCGVAVLTVVLILFVLADDRRSAFNHNPEIG